MPSGVLRRITFRIRFGRCWRYTNPDISGAVPGIRLSRMPPAYPHIYPNPILVCLPVAFDAAVVQDGRILAAVVDDAG